MTLLVSGLKYARAFTWVFVAIAMATSLMLASSSPAAAEADKTYVSGTGDDTHDCSRVFPCRSFAQAYASTGAFGQIICLDNSDFSGTGVGLSITRSVSILCGETGGSYQASVNATAISVNILSSDVVYIQGLAIDGSINGIMGISFASGGKVIVEDCEIFGFSAGVARGIYARGGPAGTVQQLFVNNSSLYNNGIDGGPGGTNQPVVGGGGVVVGNPTAPSGGATRAVLTNVKLQANNMGLRTSPSSETTVKDSTISGNVSFNVLAASSGGATLVNLDGVDASESVGGTGLRAEGVGAIIRVNRSTVIGNNLGLHPLNGGFISTTGNNLVTGNFGGNGAFNGSVPLS